MELKFFTSLLFIFLGVFLTVSGDNENGHLSKPNVEKALNRLLGLGVINPHPYYQKPKYRFPVYDKNGVGNAGLYGYGGPEVYKYEWFTPIEGSH